MASAKRPRVDAVLEPGADDADALLDDGIAGDAPPDGLAEAAPAPDESEVAEDGDDHEAAPAAPAPADVQELVVDVIAPADAVGRKRKAVVRAQVQREYVYADDRRLKCAHCPYQTNLPGSLKVCTCWFWL